MKFGQWGDSPAKEDGSFSFGPVNVVNSAAHTTPSTLIKQGETQLPRRAVAEVLLGFFFFRVGEGGGQMEGLVEDSGGGCEAKGAQVGAGSVKQKRLREGLCYRNADLGSNKAGLIMLKAIDSSG